MKGKVFLAGAGPGDPNLLTIKTQRCLASADVVIYDALVHPNVLEHCTPRALKLYVGKRGAHHAKEQEEINRLLVKHAKRGKIVVRLKGGDPFVFGRGSEEAAFLAKHHIPFEIIPGISSALGALAYAGIPLTDRHLSSMVTLATGHDSESSPITSSGGVDWARISRQSTVVIFMGLEQLAHIRQRLLLHNWPKTMPVAVIYWGTLPVQRVIEGTIDTIVTDVEKAGVTSPVLIVIGKVVALRKKLSWFEHKPLFGKKIVITRPRDQAAELAHALEDQGAEVVTLPMIEIGPPSDWKKLDDAIRQLTGNRQPPTVRTSSTVSRPLLAVPSPFDWIVFTSANGVDGFFERLAFLKKDVRDLAGIRLAAIGPKTAARLTERGLTVDCLPNEYVAEALADALKNVNGQRILVARAEEARDVLPDTLTKRGASVTVAPVYRTTPKKWIRSQLPDWTTVDAVTFTSSSTVDSFMSVLSPAERKNLFHHALGAVIGPVTEQTLRAYGVRAAIRAKRYTIESLVEAITKRFASSASKGHGH